MQYAASRHTEVRLTRLVMFYSYSQSAVDFVDNYLTMKELLLLP